MSHPQSKAHAEEELLSHTSEDKNTRGLFWVRDVLLGHNPSTMVSKLVGTTFVSSWHHCPGSDTAASPRLTIRALAAAGGCCCPWGHTHCWVTAGAGQEDGLHSCHGSYTGDAQETQKVQPFTFPALCLSEQAWICSQMTLAVTGSPVSQHDVQGLPCASHGTAWAGWAHSHLERPHGARRCHCSRLYCL